MERQVRSLKKSVIFCFIEAPVKRASDILKGDYSESQTSRETRNCSASHRDEPEPNREILDPKVATAMFPYIDLLYVT